MKILKWAVITVFLFVLILSFFVPIYTDEVIWKVVQNRTLFDGGKQMYVFPQCESFVLNPEPITRIFAFAASAWYGLFYLHNPPVVLKILGVLSALFLIFLLFVLVRKVEEKERLSTFLIFGLLPLSFGMVPLILAMNRPEQTIGFSTLILSIWLLSKGKDVTRKQNILNGLIIVATFCWLLQQHPLASFFAPLFIVATFLKNRGYFARGLAIAVLFVAMFSVHQFWTDRTTCLSGPQIQEKIGKHIALNVSATRPLKNLGGAMWGWGVFGESGFSQNYGQIWFAPDLSAFAVSINSITAILHFLLVILASFFTVTALWNDWKNRNWKTRNILAGVFLFTGVAFLVLAPDQPFYRIGLVIQTWITCIILAEKPKSFKISNFAIIFLLAFALVSLLNLTSEIVPSMQKWIKGGYIEQGYSFSPFNFASTREKILHAAKACNIYDDYLLTRLVADDLAHEVFKSVTKFPIYSEYLESTGFWSSQDVDWVKTLSSGKSSGAVGACSNLSRIHALQPLLKATEEICCVPAF